MPVASHLLWAATCVIWYFIGKYRERWLALTEKHVIVLGERERIRKLTRFAQTLLVNVHDNPSDEELTMAITKLDSFVRVLGEGERGRHVKK